MALITSQGIPPLSRKDVTPLVVSFIEQSLIVDAALRPTAHVLLGHPFLEELASNQVFFPFFFFFSSFFFSSVLLRSFFSDNRSWRHWLRIRSISFFLFFCHLCFFLFFIYSSF